MQAEAKVSRVKEDLSLSRRSSPYREEGTRADFAISSANIRRIEFPVVVKKWLLFTPAARLQGRFVSPRYTMLGSMPRPFYIALIESGIEFERIHAMAVIEDRRWLDR